MNDIRYLLIYIIFFLIEKKKITRETIASRFPKQQQKRKAVAMSGDQENAKPTQKTPKQTRKQMKKGTPNSRTKWTPPQQTEKNNNDDDDDDTDSEEDDVLPASLVFARTNVNFLRLF